MQTLFENNKLDSNIRNTMKFEMLSSDILPMSHFERKFHAVNRPLYRFLLNLTENQ